MTWAWTSVLPFVVSKYQESAGRCMPLDSSCIIGTNKTAASFSKYTHSQLVMNTGVTSSLAAWLGTVHSQSCLQTLRFNSSRKYPHHLLSRPNHNPRAIKSMKTTIAVIEAAHQRLLRMTRYLHLPNAHEYELLHSASIHNIHRASARPNTRPCTGSSIGRGVTLHYRVLFYPGARNRLWPAKQRSLYYHASVPFSQV